jgi:cellulose synthase/poly-beta-1,6-N-acetylglucosamine synthase-like glycosyltransferase
MTLAEVYEDERSRTVAKQHEASHAADGLQPIPRRILEVLPPALAWVAITSPAWAAVVAPEVLGYFLVAFSVYWLWRSCEFSIGLIIGVLRLNGSQRRNWAADGERMPGYSRMHHVVLVPTYRESDEILVDTLECIANQTAPAEKIAVVLAFEARDPEAPERAERLRARFEGRFGNLLVTMHPDLPGEVKGKSSNLHWAARRVQDELIATGKLDARNLLVTVCDADSRMDRQFLAALSVEVLSHPDGRLHIYQPAILFYANYSRLALPLRTVSSVFSLYSLARLAATHRLVPQSTYALTWWAARRVGFWDVDVVPEDSHMFFKVWLHLGKRVKTRAMYLPVYADAAEGVNLVRSVGSTYQQIRRWAWGVSDVPYLTLRTLRARHIPRYMRVQRVGWYVEEHLVWPSHWFLLTLGGMLPPLINQVWAHSSLGIWQTAAYSTFLGLCMPSLILAVVADVWLKWRSEGTCNLGVLLSSLPGFVLLPFTGLACVALPALDAHTRLLFGRSLAYQVTEKVPSTSSGSPLARAIPS